MTVKELIEKLATMPQDLEVKFPTDCGYQAIEADDVTIEEYLPNHKRFVSV